jgi:hypothetical protein
MSFSYKTLSSNDITLTSYIANKQWEVNSLSLSENGIKIYVGENIPITSISPFNPTNDTETTNEEYRRLIFSSIQHLFYKNYISGSNTGSFFRSSPYINYEQSTLSSGSSLLTTLRYLPQKTGSSNPNFSSYDEGIIYDGGGLYDDTSYDGDRGSKIAVISIDQNIFGSGLSPNSVFMSSSTYYLRDDGEGNFFDYYNEENYLNPISSSLIGNVFYSFGLIVITNENYLCSLNLPPTAVNDYFSSLNLDTPKIFDILGNDYSDCGNILFDSFTTHSIEGYTFPTFTYDNGFITILNEQPNYIPGEYKIGYTILNNNLVSSNTASINLNITSQPLQIENLITSSVCFGNVSMVPVTFSINYGVPYYSYSLDNGATYTGVNSLSSTTISGSITASSNNIIYIKDYLNEIITASFSTLYPEITAYTQITKPPCSTTSQNGIIYVSSNTAISASIGSTRLKLPNSFSGIGTGSIVLGLTSSFGCTTSSIIQVGVYPALTASVTQSNVSCYGGNNGYLEVNFTNVIDNSLVFLTDPTSSLIYNGIPINNFPNNSVTASNLGTGSYSLQLIVSDAMTQCQNYTSSFNITSSSPILFNVTASYINSCSNQVIFNATGGNGTYTYYAVNTGSNIQYSSTTSPLNLGSTNGGTFSTFVIDNNNCVSTSSLLNVYGRIYIYSGSSCETI